MRRKRIVILGAGLAGLSAAWHLQKKGIGALVLEKEPEVGGLARSKAVNGFNFDCDGHLLHFKRHDTFKLVKDLLGGNLKKHKRSAWVYACGRYIPYPFQANLHQLPAAVVQECLLGLAKAARDGLRQEGNFLDWIYRHFGKGIARHFMVPYNTKFWTLPPERLSCEWLDGFVPLPTLSQMIAGSVEDTPREFGCNSTVWYPKTGGINQLALALAAGLKNIHTHSEVTEIDLKAKKVKISGGESENYDYLISTLPLPELPRLVKNMPRKMKDLFARLNWNSILNVNLGLDKRDGASRHWAYFPQREHCFFRVGFYHNFSSSCAPQGKGALYAEIAYPRGEAPQKKNILARMEADLKNTGLLNGSRIIASDINEIKYGYPIYDLNYSRARGEIIRYLARARVIPCGRYGSWRYFSMEDSLLDGKRVTGLF